MSVKNVGSSPVSVPFRPDSGPVLDLVLTGRARLGLGMTGEAVQQLQRLLVQKGVLADDQVDGVFGERTLAAVKAFQASAGLSVDGMVGSKTMAGLSSRGHVTADVMQRPSPPRVALAPVGGPSATPNPAMAAEAAAANTALRFAAVMSPRAPASKPPPGPLKLTSSALFTEASAADQAKLLDLARAGQTEVMLRLGKTLFSQDAKGTRMLDSAQQLATGPMKAELEPERQAILSHVLGEAADPSTIDQQQRGTCNVTSLEISLAKKNPAEVVRLVAGLSSPEGKVEMADGSVLARATGTERPDDSERTPSQRLLQTALITFGRGAAGYSNTRAEHGLGVPEIATVESALTGRPAHAVGVGLIGGRGLMAALGDIGIATANGLTFNKFHFSKDNTDLLDQVTTNGPGTVAALRWGTGGHAVSFDRVSDGRVYFSNPHGNQLAAGQNYADPPPRRSEGTNVQSMTVAEFRANLCGLVAH